MGKVPRVAILTFATKHNERPFNDYSQRIRELEENSKEFSLDFFLYTFEDLTKLTAGTKFESFPYFRRGVGGWFWKPIIILDLLEKIDHEFVIYMDVDCEILKNPQVVIQNLPLSAEVSGFRMSSEIEKWTTPRILRRFKAKEVSKNLMWTAGILIIRNSEISRQGLALWLNSMSNPLNLFDLPFERNASRHRHDQSVLSILAEQEKIRIHDLASGFYSKGIESTVSDSSQAWISTATHFSEVKELNQINFRSRLKNQYHYRRIRSTRYTFWIHYFLRNLLSRYL